MVTVELAHLTDLHGLVQPGIHAHHQATFGQRHKTMVYSTQAGWPNTRACSGTTGPLLASQLAATFKADIKTTEPYHLLFGLPRRCLQQLIPGIYVIVADNAHLLVTYLLEES